MISLGMAMEKTGLIHTVSAEIVDVLRDYGPTAVMAGIYLLSAVITSLISNTAVALLLTPIALDVAGSMGYEPAPFVFAVLFGASACFATPMGYQTNLFVYGPGGYRFTDFMRVGVPLNFVLFLTALVVIPWYWPFERIS
jgi:di/tricarboxylate transporter